MLSTAFQWCRGQPEAVSEKTGKTDLRWCQGRDRGEAVRSPARLVHRWGLKEVSTVRRIEAAARATIGAELARDLVGALSYFMENPAALAVAGDEDWQARIRGDRATQRADDARSRPPARRAAGGQTVLRGRPQALPSECVLMRSEILRKLRAAFDRLLLADETSSGRTIAAKSSRSIVNYLKTAQPRYSNAPT